MTRLKVNGPKYYEEHKDSTIPELVVTVWFVIEKLENGEIENLDEQDLEEALAHYLFLKDTMCLGYTGDYVYQVLHQFFEPGL